MMVRCFFHFDFWCDVNRRLMRRMIVWSNFEKGSSSRTDLNSIKEKSVCFLFLETCRFSFDFSLVQRNDICQTQFSLIRIDDLNHSKGREKHCLASILRCALDSFHHIITMCQAKSVISLLVQQIFYHYLHSIRSPTQSIYSSNRDWSAKKRQNCMTFSSIVNGDESIRSAIHAVSSNSVSLGNECHSLNDYPLSISVSVMIIHWLTSSDRRKHDAFLRQILFILLRRLVFFIEENDHIFWIDMATDIKSVIDDDDDNNKRMNEGNWVECLR